MERWTTKLIRLHDGITEATVPSTMDESVLNDIRKGIRPVCLPAWTIPDESQDFILLPAACGSKLFARLAGNTSTKVDAPASKAEVAAWINLRGFRRAVGLRLSNSSSVDVCKVASCFDVDDYRRKSPSMRSCMVTVDKIGGTASYIPPPPPCVPPLLNNLYGMISRRADTIESVMALAFYGMCHFIAIHPLVDGNGRTGRALFIRVCGKGGVPAPVAGALIALMHSNYFQLFHSSLMKYCLTGHISDLVEVFKQVLGDLREKASPQFEACNRDIYSWGSKELNGKNLYLFRDGRARITDWLA